MNLAHWKIGTRIAMMASSLLILFVVLGGFTWRSLSVDAERLNASNDQSRQFQLAIDLARGAQVTFKIQVQEWKNFLLRGGDSEAYAKYKKGFFKEGEETQAKLKQLKALLQELNLPLNGVDEALASHDKLLGKYTEAMSHYDVANADVSARAVDKMVKGIDRAPTAQIDTIVAEVFKASSQRHDETEVITHAGYKQSLWMLSGLMVVALCIGTIGAVVILRSITEPLHRVVEVATGVADGNLRARIDVSGHDETSQVMAAMSRMNNSLAQVVTQVRQASQFVAHASSEIASGNMDLSNLPNNKPLTFSKLHRPLST